MGKKAVLIFSILFLTMSYQACNKPEFSKIAPLESLKADLNGEGYSGKPTPYDLRNSQTPCSEVGANGQPLPNRQIFVFPSGFAALVRDACSDIAPIAINPGEYSLASDGSLLYQNQTFITNANQGDFDVVAATCPAGRSLLPNPVRTSLLTDPLDFKSPAWNPYNMTISLEGSMGSLPLFHVQRLDPNALDNWRRVSQHPTLVNGESYVYTVFVKPNGSNKALFLSFYPNVEDVEIEIDLITGKPTVLGALGWSGLVTKSQKFAGGFIVNFYFQSTADVKPDFGLGPQDGSLGSSISFTAQQLEKVSNFCGP